MFTVSPNCTNKALLDYLKLEPVKTSKCALERIFGRKKRKRMYTYKERDVLHHPKGLTKFLRKTFYKHFQHKPWRFQKGRVKLASSKLIGKRVDKEIFNRISGNETEMRVALRDTHFCLKEISFNQYPQVKQKEKRRAASLFFYILPGS